METLFVDSTYILLGKLLLAAVLGMIIGMERAFIAKRPAGMRTFSLVALGACLFTLTGTVVDNSFLGLVNFDPMRMAAGIVQGVGFIGAGLIIFRGDSIHGVTTAAGLWVAAAVGVAVAFGMYSISIFASLVTVVILAGVWYLENTIKGRLGIPLPEEDTYVTPR